MRYLFHTLLATFILASCGGKKEAIEVPIRPVAFQTVDYGYGISDRSFNGVAETDKVINLSFRSSGIITQFDIYLGQKVKKGELLAQLDNVSARLAYEQSISTLKSAESQMKTSKLSYDRTRTLYEQGSASLSDFENTKNAYQNAESSYESALRSVGIQKEQINYGYIYAPDEGIISSVSAEIGENAQPGQTVGVLNAGEKIIIRLGLPENIINDVQENMKVKISFSALSNKLYNGYVSEVSPAIDQTTSTYQAKVTLSNVDNLIKSGMAATVSFVFDQSSAKALIIPAKAVGEDSKGRFVFLIDEGEKTTVKKQPVKIGELNTNGFEILEGLRPGQKIAVAGLQTLIDGQEVKLLK